MGGRERIGNFMKFGDLILNECASKDNPIRVTMFVKCSGKDVICMDSDGETVRYDRRSKDEFLKVIGSIDFKPLNDALKRERSK